MREFIETSEVPKPTGPYSQGIKVGNRVYVAGQVPFDPATGQIVGTTLEEQARQVIINVRTVLQAAGADLRHVVKSTVHLQNVEDIAQFNCIYIEYFHPPYPVRTTVGSELNGLLIEMDVIAELDSL